MVRYWIRHRRRLKATVNGIGATATGLVTLIVAYTKFGEGAWLVVVAIPLLVLAMYGIRRHYLRLARRLRAGAAAVVAAPAAHNTTLLLVEALDDAAGGAVRFANEISRAVRAIHVPTRRTNPGIRPRWFARHGSSLKAL